jgi:hypothetical protein
VGQQWGPYPKGPCTIPCLGSPRFDGSFSPTSTEQAGRDVAPYLPGRGCPVIKNARDLGCPALHTAGALAYHLPKWKSGRRNL